MTANEGRGKREAFVKTECRGRAAPRTRRSCDLPAANEKESNDLDSFAWS